jgi:pimeloyl-ACP methyl ester carboxylesterase
MTDTDVVVVLPGIMGSTLGVTTNDGRGATNLVWAPTAGAVWNNMTGRYRIQDYALPDGIGDEHPGDGVEPVEVMPDVHAIPGVWTPIKGYTVLVKRLQSLGYQRYQVGQPRSGNLLLVPYDWRLSNRYNGQRLSGIVEPALARWRSQGGRFADAQLVFVCHSMGGLVARWYLERCGGAGHTRKLITLGTPWRGAAEAVGQLVNGVEPGIGPIHLDLTRFARSLPSLYQLLPEYACLTDGPREHKKTTEATATLPLTTKRVTDAMALYTTLQEAEQHRPASRQMTHALVGARQPTVTTVTINPDLTATVLETFGADNDYGDGTVPLTGAIGHDDKLDTPSAFRVRDRHGNLQRNPQILDQIEEILTTKGVRRRNTQPVTVRVRAPHLLPADQPLDIDIDIDEGDGRQAVRVTVADETGHLLQARQPTARAGHAHATFTGLPAGTHTITIDSPSPTAAPHGGPNYGGMIEPVTATTLIWPII